MHVLTLKDYLQKITDEHYIVMDENGTVYGTGGPQGNLLADAVLNQPLLRIVIKPCKSSDHTELILFIQPL